tara:strand:- start:110 stop:310 length:201 start_codon:yes stop_codon:yes gene_type:complete
LRLGVRIGFGTRLRVRVGMLGFTARVWRMLVLTLPIFLRLNKTYSEGSTVPLSSAAMTFTGAKRRG